MLTQGNEGRDWFGDILLIFISVKSDQFFVYCLCVVKRKAKAD